MKVLKFFMNLIKILLYAVLFTTAFFCSSLHKPIENNNLKIMKNILEKKTLDETDKKLLTKIINNEENKNKEEKKYIKNLEIAKENADKISQKKSENSGKYLGIRNLTIVFFSLLFLVFLWKVRKIFMPNLPF